MEPALDTLVKDGKLAGSWVLDPARSTVTLKSKGMWGLAPVSGSFGQLTGSGTVSATGDATGSLVIAAGSIDTKNARRDKHLRSADFFDVDNHPSITFEVQSVSPAGAGATVTGTLTVRDATKPLSFDATVGALTDGEVSLDANVQINRADYGVSWNMMGMTSWHSTIAIHAVFKKA